MQRVRFLGLVLLVPACMAFTTGCLRGGAALGTGLLVGISLATLARSQQEPPPTTERVVVVHDPQAAAPLPRSPLPSPPLSAAPAPAVPSAASAVAAVAYEGRGQADEGPFDQAEGRLALQRADVFACRPRGVPQDNVHALVTFASTGTVRSIVVDAPPGLSPDAVACLGERIGAVSVSTFDGPDETLSASWSVP